MIWAGSSGRGAARHTDAIGAITASARQPGLRGPGPLALRAALPGAAAWTVGLAVLTLLVIDITPTTKDSVAATLQESPAFAQLFKAAGLSNDAGFLSGLLFFLLPLLLTFYALTSAGDWARDLDAGARNCPSALRSRASASTSRTGVRPSPRSRSHRSSSGSSPCSASASGACKSIRGISWPRSGA